MSKLKSITSSLYNRWTQALQDATIITEPDAKASHLEYLEDLQDQASQLLKQPDLHSTDINKCNLMLMTDVKSHVTLVKASQSKDLF